MKKFLRLSALYICITLLTTVGTVFLAKFTSSTANNNNSDSFGTSFTVEEPTAFDKMLEGIMSANGFEIDLNAELVADDVESLPITAHLYVDLSNGFEAVALQAHLAVEEKLSLDVTFKDKWLYLTVLGGNYKIQTDKISDIVKIVTQLIDGTEESGAIETLEDVNLDGTEVETSNSGFDVSKIMESLQTMTEEKNEFGYKLSGNLLGIDFSILTDFNYNIVEATTSEIQIDKYKLTPHVSLNYLEEVKEIVVDEAAYLDLSTIDKLVYAVINTAKLTDFHITTNLKIDMQIASIDKPISMDIPIDVKIKLVNNKPQIMAQFGPIPVIAPVNNDVHYAFGDTVSGLYCGLNRILNLYYADGYVYFYRSETVPVFGSSSGRLYEKKLKITLEEFMDDPLMLLSYGFGFQDIIMNEITKDDLIITGNIESVDFEKYE